MTIEEPEKMARGEIRARTVYYKLSLLPCQYKYGWQRLFTFCRKYSRYLASIDRNDFEGTRSTNSDSPAPRTWWMSYSLVFVLCKPVIFPQTAKVCTLISRLRKTPFLTAWTQTLETVKWKNASAFFSYFPPHLKELYTEKPMAIWLDYPRDLAKLTPFQGPGETKIGQE